MDLVCEWQLLPRLRSHVAQASREPLLNEDEVQCVKHRLADFLTSKGFPCKVEVPPGQPLTLDLWRALLLFCDDIDMKLPCILREGVPTGILADILPSGVWRAVDKPERPEGVELEILEEPWGSALEDPDCSMRLVQADVEAGFADWIPGGVEDARRIFGANCAAGKLGLVKKAGSEPRLVGDSSISCANQLSRIREKIELPSLFDIEQFVSRHPRDKWIAFSLDVAKAHKHMRVHPSEQGFSSFCAVDSAGQNHWLVYRTCHFGAAWSAYWWSRAGAAYVRCVHRLPHGGHFLAMYVDDLLALFKQTDAPLQASLCIMLACALGVPLSWHKLQLSTDLSWIGWRLCFAGEPCASLPDDKRVRLGVALRALVQEGNSVCRRELRQLLGMLCWFTTGARWLRPWLSELFHLLFKQHLRFQKLDAGQVHELAGVLSDSMRVLAKCRLSDILPGWQLLSTGSREVTTKQELLGLPHRGGWWWVKFGDPASAKVKVSKAEAAVARFITQVINECVPVPLVVSNATGLAAADVCRGPNSRSGGLVASSWCSVAARVFAIISLPASRWMICRIGSDQLLVICKAASRHWRR